MFKTPPISIIDLAADKWHFTPGRPGRPRFIVLHATGGTNSGNWLTTTSIPPVSVHRLITTGGQVYKLVADEDTAWGCGPSHMGPYFPSSTMGNMNAWALQIELEGLNKQGSIYPNSQIQSTALQVAEWLGKFGPMPILHHSMIDEAKSDPASFPDEALLQAILFYWQ